MIRSSDPVVEFSGYYLAGASQTGSSYYEHRAFCRLRWQSQIGQSTKTSEHPIKIAHKEIWSD